MSQPSARPQLTPQLCFSTTVLRDFLRTSRATVDDSITQHLNALVLPARAGFDPSSTSSRQNRSIENRFIDAHTCQAFKERALFQSWQNRSDVLSYCAGVATSPDPDDPESLIRQVESAKDRERVVDERLDPYSARFFPREARTELLADLIRNERGVENIIRERSWSLLGERCGFNGSRWEEDFSRWRERQPTST